MKYYRYVHLLFMLPSYEEMISSKYIYFYYMQFMLNAFCLTIALSVIFYDENTTFLQYSYPVLVFLVFLSDSRFLQYANKELLREFFGVIYGLVISIILLLFMKLMNLIAKLESSSLLALPFIKISLITGEDFVLTLLLSFTVCALLSIFERLQLVKKLRSKIV